MTWEEGSLNQLHAYYEGFRAVDPPAGSGALRAWIGELRPLPNGSELEPVFHHLQFSGNILELGVQGALIHPSSCTVNHRWDHPSDFDADCDRTFEVLLLDFGPQINPRVYGVRPEISRPAFPNYPHFRDDQTILFRGRLLPALCTYLSTDAFLSRDEMRLVHAIDFTAMFLAKHTFYAFSSKLLCDVCGATFPYSSLGFDQARLLGSIQNARCIFDGTVAEVASVYRRDAFTPPPSLEERLSKPTTCRFHAVGKWIGDFAPHIPEELLQLDEEAECPCGKGLSYGHCCRPFHSDFVRQNNKRLREIEEFSLSIRAADSASTQQRRRSRLASAFARAEIVS